MALPYMASTRLSRSDEASEHFCNSSYTNRSRSYTRRHMASFSFISPHSVAVADRASKSDPPTTGTTKSHSSDDTNLLMMAQRVRRSWKIELCALVSVIRRSAGIDMRVGR